MSGDGQNDGGGGGSNPFMRWGVYLLIIIVINVVLVMLGVNLFVY